MPTLSMFYNNMCSTGGTPCSTAAAAFVISLGYTDVFSNGELPNHHAADRPANYCDTK